MARYKYKSGRSFPVPAQVVGERLEQIRGNNPGDDISPAEVVEDARNPESPLHDVFDWNDETAAKKQREHRARQLLAATIVVTIQVIGGRPEPVEQFAFVSVGRSVPGGARYVTTARAMNDAEMRDRVVSDAIAGLQAWRRRFGHISELAEIVEAIDRAPAPAMAM